jgi:hypothetical protein
LIDKTHGNGNEEEDEDILAVERGGVQQSGAKEGG